MWPWLISFSLGDRPDPVKTHRSPGCVACMALANFVASILDFIQVPGCPSAIETHSLPTFTRSYPRHFTFYVARPTRSIRRRLTHAFPRRVADFPRSTTSGAISHRKVFSRKPLPPYYAPASAFIMCPAFRLPHSGGIVFQR